MTNTTTGTPPSRDRSLHLQAACTLLVAVGAAYVSTNTAASSPNASAPTGQDKVGFTLRQPCGVIVAIAPFNYPALLVLHKLGPALAAGNAVVLNTATALG